MTLKTLDEHNKEARNRRDEWRKYPKKNGIACPKCGEELLDSNNMMLASNPPQKDIHCDKCDYRGYRVA